VWVLVRVHFSFKIAVAVNLRWHLWHFPILTFLLFASFRYPFLVVFVFLQCVHLSFLDMILTSFASLWFPA